MSVKPGRRGRFAEDFETGDVYEHPLGRTVTQTDTVMTGRRGNGPSIPRVAS